MNEELLLQYYSELVAEIAERIESTDLTKPEKVEKLVEELKDLFRSSDLVLEEAIPSIVLDSFFNGVEEASMLLASAGVVGALQGSNSRTYVDVLSGILDDTLGDLKAAIRTAEYNSIKNIQDTLDLVKADIAKGAFESRKSVTKKVMVNFQKGGLTSFITKDGKKLPLDFYSSLVVRTKSRDAAVTGATTRYEELEQDLVKIQGNKDTCEVCARHQGLVVSLTGKTKGFPTTQQVKLPPYHPHCNCTIMPWVIEAKTEGEIRKAQKDGKNFDPEKDVRTPAQKKAYERQQQARRKANAEKKLYGRWQMVLGPDAPKTLGAFRRMKRQNTIKYQELSDRYRETLRSLP